MSGTRTSNEAAILAAILLDLGGRPGIRLFRNSTGRLRDRRGIVLTYGLCVGSSDIIGIKTTHTIGSIDSPGVSVGQFVALEVKDRGRLTEEQKDFLAMVLSMGGIAACVRSVDEARTALGV